MNASESKRLLSGAVGTARVTVQLDLLVQRWQGGVHTWRRRSEGGFRSSEYVVERVDEAVAKAFVVEHHYSRSYPAARLRYCLRRREDGVLVGVIVLSVPVQAAVLTGVFPRLEPYQESLELGRMVLLDEVLANGESWMLGQVFADVARLGIRGVVSFSDPVPRRRKDGSLLFPGHFGTCYQAFNGVYTGRGSARSILVLSDGTVLNARAISKVRRQERGHDHVERRLVALGAHPRSRGADPARWLEGALDDIGARLQRHPGCHRYAWCLGRSRREREAVLLAPASMAYPKRDVA